MKEGHYSPLIPRPLLNFRDKAAGKSKNLPRNFQNVVVDENKLKQKWVWCKNREKASAQKQVGVKYIVK